MSDTPETVAAILAEMRDKRIIRLGDADVTRCMLLNLADRIEAAAKRERENTIYAGRDGEMTLDECITRCNNNSGDSPRGRDVAQIGGWLRELRERRRATGNAAALRAAIQTALEYCESDQKSGIAYSDNDVLVPMLRTALAAPPRNCDVGTAQEQIDRFYEFCHSNRYYIDEFHGDDCRPDCQIGKIVDRDNKFCDNCWAAWAQMPFAPAEGGAKCVNGLRGEPDCRGCNEHCEDVRKRNCFYWNPDIEGGVCAMTGKKSCPISCDNFRVSKEEKPDPVEGETK